MWALKSFLLFNVKLGCRVKIHHLPAPGTQTWQNDPGTEAWQTWQTMADMTDRVNPLMHSTFFFSNFLFKFTGDMPFRTQMTNINSFFSYLKIYPPFLAKNFKSLLGLECVTPSRVTFPYFSWICTCKWHKNDSFTLFLTN